MGGAWPHRLGVSSLAAGLLTALALSASAPAAPSTHACPRPRGGPPGFSADRSRCLGVTVPLDRSGAVPGTIRLRVRIEPPSSGTANDTVFALAGGPGQAATPLLDTFRFTLGGAVLRARRLVTFDQRGTGASGRLRCPELDAVPFAGPNDNPAAQRAVAACAARLGPARAHYATADSVQDVEAVRAALGIDRFVLYGTSYGTKIALDYAAAYPQHVERLVLDSVVPPEGVDAFERSTIAAIPSVLRAECADGACPFTHDAGADLEALGRRLGRGPLRGSVIDGHGRPRPASVVSSDLYPLLLIGDEFAGQRALVPAAVRAALDGDPALLLRLVRLRFGGFDTSGPDSSTLTLVTRCEDGRLPWAPGTPIDARPASIASALAAIPPLQLAPFGPADVRAFGQTDLCRSWPEAPIAQPRPPLADVPTLILSGDRDLRTPRSDALALAARIPGAQVVGVPGAGHATLLSDPGHCARSALTDFLAGRDPGHCARSALTDFLAGREPRVCQPTRPDAQSAPLGLPPRALRDVRPLGPRRLAPDVRRTLGAVSTTLDVFGRTFFVDLEAAIERRGAHPKAIRIGGLRGGCAVLTSSGGSFLRRYSIVPGVTLSQQDPHSFPDSSRSRLRIGGRSAVHGWLRIGRRWTTGRLDGQRLRVPTRLLDPGHRNVISGRATAARLPDHPRLPSVPPWLLGWR